MNIDCTQATIRPLAARSMLRVETGAGTRISAKQGNLWLTQDGDADDVMVAPGETVTLKHDSPALVYAFDDGVVQICTDAAGREAGWALTRWLRRNLEQVTVVG